MYKNIINQYVQSFSAFKEPVESSNESVEERYGTIVDLSAKTLQVAIAVLNTQLPELQELGVAIATTGSDARLEKTGIASPIELIFITSALTEKQQELIKKIEGIVKGSEFAQLFYPAVEVKDLSATGQFGYMSEYVGLKKRKIIPTRALDAVRLVGCKDVFAQYKTQFVQEIVGTQVKLPKFKRESVDYAKRALKHDLLLDVNTQQQEITTTTTAPLPSIKPLPQSLDLPTGSLFFNNNDVKGHKFGAMRYLQYGVALVTLRALKSKNIKAEDLVKTFPQGVCERIGWLVSRKIMKLTEEQACSLKMAYKASLVWYSQLQAAANGNNKVVVKVEPEKLRSTLTTVLELGKKMLKV